jgi:hypothetical protein
VRVVTVHVGNLVDRNEGKHESGTWRSGLLILGYTCTAACLTVAWLGFLGWVAARAIGVW